jgi:hypothetical protein
VPVPSQVSERSDICVLSVSILPLSTMFWQCGIFGFLFFNVYIETLPVQFVYSYNLQYILGNSAMAAMSSFHGDSFSPFFIFGLEIWLRTNFSLQNMNKEY